MRTLVTTGGRRAATDVEEITRCFANCAVDGFWLDIESPDETDYQLLEETFKFHSLTIEDVRHQNQRPKVDEYPDYNFAVIFQAEWRDDEIKSQEHHLYVGANYLISVHAEPTPVLRELQDRVEKSPELTKGQPAFLTYLVIDALVDATFPVLEKLDETVDQLEDDITQKASPESLNRIYHLKSQVTEMRRFLGAQRDVFQRLITHGIHLQQQDMTLYYRDVYDHIVRQYETVDSVRDLLTSAMDVYLSTVSNRLNQTVKALTVIASLFLPLSFLTGFYGMNFALLVSVLEAPYVAFFIGVGTMVLAIGFQLFLFRRRGWI
ncbi:MAG: magnesium and cobalt transport protein CorA [Actinobacteria bacterium 13_1_20CM_2_65_11]|nr:MAG: magnesium and cobalt transport protein CorA [Chloroflexi bacterium 13_1_40CM_65_17]OLC49231.1 MAG: magnesium and cobalt transport protein CorA [Chloroflexi bacterium 13_1_40CM_4_65_13]OLD24194.1 MAG: magnesium and cobalt transport protein CorA [Chloroflexi bacterium 13_1_40CM_3_65_12]OLD49687.1 MAG: magnesium and cobalt transport protein CorA [Actinobacteria bacterium 13_1_40CM_2_65_8]OLE81328.1 MAG: magnesium and cobalt transport protein CorA [Actinobacteria bacterium 13_1_20CM_2_65_11